MRSKLILLAMLAAAGPVGAQSREDYDAAAALALHAACKPIAAAPAAALTLVEAKEYTRSRRFPVLVRVGGLDCATLCTKLRPEIPACHVEELAGDHAPHLRLMLAGADGALWLSGERWTALPQEADVRRVAAEMKHFVDSPAQVLPAWSNCPGGNCPRR